MLKSERIGFVYFGNTSSTNNKRCRILKTYFIHTCTYFIVCNNVNKTRAR